LAANEDLQEALQKSAMLVEYYQAQIETQAHEVEILQTTLSNLRSTRTTISALEAVEEWMY